MSSKGESLGSHLVQIFIITAIFLTSAISNANKERPLLQCAKTLGFTSMDGNYISYAKPKTEKGPGFLLVMNEHGSKLVPVQQQANGVSTKFIPVQGRTAYQYTRTGRGAGVRESIIRTVLEESASNRFFQKVGLSASDDSVSDMEAKYKVDERTATRYLGLAALLSLEQFPEKKYRLAKDVQLRLNNLKLCESLGNGNLIGAITSRKKNLQEQLRALSSAPAESLNKPRGGRDQTRGQR